MHTVIIAVLFHFTFTGPCARTLDAGELIWMTDKTPHESLPIPVAVGNSSRPVEEMHQTSGIKHTKLEATPAQPQRRQFFRLVVGEVTAWFADHSTPNPLASIGTSSTSETENSNTPLQSRSPEHMKTTPPASVRIVTGNKFHLYPPTTTTTVVIPTTANTTNTTTNSKISGASASKLLIQSGDVNWQCGTAVDIQVARDYRDLMLLACKFGLGHFHKRFFEYGIRSIRQLVQLEELQIQDGLDIHWECWGKDYSLDGRPLMIGNSTGYYENVQLHRMIEKAKLSLC